MYIYKKNRIFPCNLLVNSKKDCQFRARKYQWFNNINKAKEAKHAAVKHQHPHIDQYTTNLNLDKAPLNASSYDIYAIPKSDSPKRGRISLMFNKAKQNHIRRHTRCIILQKPAQDPLIEKIDKEMENINSHTPSQEYREYICDNPPDESKKVENWLSNLRPKGMKNTYGTKVRLLELISQEI